jgi:hypothetical protein
MSGHDEILALINTTHADMKEIVKSEICGITKRLDTLNGSVARLQAESNKRQKDVDDFRRLESEIGGIRRKWFYLLLGAALFIAAVVFVYDVIGLRGIYEMITR